MKGTLFTKSSWKFHPTNYNKNNMLAFYLIFNFYWCYQVNVLKEFVSMYQCNMYVCTHLPAVTNTA